MASMTADFGRLAGSIATLRSQRHEATAERKKITQARPLPVHRFLLALKKERAAMGHEQRQEARATTRARRSQVRALLAQLHRRQSALAVEARTKATAFMRDLTKNVAALRDSFAPAQAHRVEECRDLARTTRATLSQYHGDRAGAVSAWKGSRPQKAAKAEAPIHHSHEAVAHEKPAESSQLGRRPPAAEVSKPRGRGA
jgi:hypothetical protein